MRLALDQWRPVSAGPDEGLVRLDRAARIAAAGGADVLLVPEMALTGYNIGAAAAAAAAEPEGGRLDRELAATARRHGIAIVAGYPRRDAAGRTLNSARLVDRTGATLATYAKAHLYGAVDRAQFAAGERLSPVVALGGWRVGLAICYDVEFPETIRALRLAGAEVVLAPTANMAPYESVARRLVPARAEENGVYVAYANYCGAEAEFDYVGLSCVCGPDGADLARAGRGEQTLFADLDRGALAAARRLTTQHEDRRPELYGSLVREGGRE